MMHGNTPVQMVSADIRIKIPSCEVEVNYVFENTSDKKTAAQMGFPEESVKPENSKQKTWFKSFDSWVDGKEIAGRVAPVHL